MTSPTSTRSSSPTPLSKVWLTPAAHQRLTEELAELETVRIPALEETLVEAQKSGKLIDNGDLDAAFSERAMVLARISQIEQTLSTAVVREAPAEVSEAGVGTWVTLRDPDGSEEKYLFSSPENRVPGAILLSPNSPLGQALLGASVGAKVSYKTPAGVYSVELVAVEPFTD